MSWSWRLVVTGVSLGTHYTFKTNLPGLSLWTEDRQMKKRGWDEGREIETQEWETQRAERKELDWVVRGSKRRVFSTERCREESERSACPEMTWYVLVSLNLWVLWRSRWEGGVEAHSNLLHKQRTELAVSQPAFNSTVISNPLHKSTLFCTHLLYKAAACTWKDKTRGRRKGDSHPSFCFLSFSFLSFTHLHQPLSVYIESGEIKREGEKNKCQGKKRTIKGGRGGAATFESITS